METNAYLSLVDVPLLHDDVSVQLAEEFHDWLVVLHQTDERMLET